jgi:hypothetical protein
MPKIIFDATEKKDIPEHLLSQAKELEGGGWELDAKGVLSKNKELLKDNAKLGEKVSDLEAAKEAAEESAKEWKGKANIPADKQIVDKEVAELGEAAKAAQIFKDEMPTLKTKADDLQAKLDARDAEAINTKVAEMSGKDAQAWREHATANNLRYEKRTEKVDNEDKEYFVVFKKGEDGTETEAKLSDYLTSSAAHVKDAEDAVQKKSGVQFPVQKSVRDSRPPDLVEQEKQAARQSGKYAL